MGRFLAFLVLVLVVVHASHACNVHGNVSFDNWQTTMPSDGSMEEQTLRVGAPKVDSPKGNSIDNKKNFIYSGVVGFAGMGNYGGIAGRILLLGGLCGIGKYGGVGGAARIGGYIGIGGLGGLIGVEGLGSSLKGGSGLGDASGSGIFPSP